jgi:hypothetical protein
MKLLVRAPWWKVIVVALSFLSCTFVIMRIIGNDVDLISFIMYIFMRPDYNGMFITVLYLFILPAATDISLWDKYAAIRTTNQKSWLKYRIIAVTWITLFFLVASLLIFSAGYYVISKHPIFGEKILDLLVMLVIVYLRLLFYGICTLGLMALINNKVIVYSVICIFILLGDANVMSMKNGGFLFPQYYLFGYQNVMNGLTSIAYLFVIVAVLTYGTYVIYTEKDYLP